MIRLPRVTLRCPNEEFISSGKVLPTVKVERPVDGGMQGVSIVKPRDVPVM